MSKRRGQADATLRNVRASKRRDETIEDRVHRLEGTVKDLARQVRELTLRGLRAAVARV